MNNTFEFELRQIINDDIRHIVIEALKVAPEYFWTVPASSTGKYHPSYALGNGGLVRHTKAAVLIALELFRNNTVQNFTDEEKDLIIASLILHDTAKSGFRGSKYTVTEHPMLVKNLFEQINVHERCIGYAEQINELVESHMGQWRTDRYGKVVLPECKTKMQRFVHLCDYLASRKCIEINFSVVG